MKRNFYTLILMAMLVSFSAQSELLRIGYPEFQPYTYTENGVAKGVGIEVIKQVSENLALAIKLIPIETHGNGFIRLKKGKLDAVLLATANEQRDQDAQFSAPIAENIWSWFFLANPDTNYSELILDKDLRVSSITNTNTHQWLIKNKYRRVSTTIDITAMLRQIDRERIDAIFIAEHVLKHKLKSLNLNLNAFHIQRQLRKPFGIYVSHRYLEDKPMFMPKLNKEIAKYRVTSDPQ